MKEIQWAVAKIWLYFYSAEQRQLGLTKLIKKCGKMNILTVETPLIGAKHL
jgi:hypothetical protein